MSLMLLPLLGLALAAWTGPSGPPGAQGFLAQTASTEASRPVTPSGAVPLPPPRPIPADGIAARINNEIITWKDVDDSQKKIRKEDITPELRRSKLRELAEEKLFLQAAKQNNITVTEQEMDDLMAREIKNMGGEEEFEKILRLSGMTKTEYREMKRRTYLVYKLHRHLVQKAFTNPDEKTPGLMIDTVEPELLRKFYDEHRDLYKRIENITFWRIGLQFSSLKEKEEKHARGEALIRKIDKGTDIYILAHFESNVWRTTANGREFGARGITRQEASELFKPETVTYLFDTLKVGELSMLWEDSNTWNIFRVEQRVNQREESFEEAQVKIRAELENRKREENRRQLRDHLVKGAYIWPAGLFDAE
jgi:hypothetical protein